MLIYNGVSPIGGRGDGGGVQIAICKSRFSFKNQSNPNISMLSIFDIGRYREEIRSPNSNPVFFVEGLLRSPRFSRVHWAAFGVDPGVVNGCAGLASK